MWNCARLADRCRALLCSLTFGRCYSDESGDSHDVSTLSALESRKSSTPAGKRLVKSALHSGSVRVSAAAALGGGDGPALGETRLDDDRLRLVVYLARAVAGGEARRTFRFRTTAWLIVGRGAQPIRSPQLLQLQETRSSSAGHV